MGYALQCTSYIMSPQQLKLAADDKPRDEGLAASVVWWAISRPGGKDAVVVWCLGAQYVLFMMYVQSTAC